jgi:putative cardiolipin synthase
MRGPFFGFDLQRSCQIPWVAGATGFLSPRLRSALAMALALLLAAALAGCGSLPNAAGKAESRALPPPAQSPLVNIAKASTPPGELTGFRLLPLGSFALDARLQLIQRASHSLDVQYYIIENDATGRLFLRSLRDAAVRGVRVRLLVDDLFTAQTDPILRALAEYPNMQVRLFNPFCCARDSLEGRFVASALDLYRLNHRMHNKLLIADGVMAIAGGRNIADEYFMLDMSSNFVDLDTFLMGAVVPQLQHIFDKYWNSDIVYPVQALVPLAVGPRELHTEFARLSVLPQGPPELIALDALGYGPLSEDLDAGRVGLIWAPARAFADPPNKLARMSAEEARENTVSAQVRAKLWDADRELVLTSPYLIPGPKGIQIFEDLGRRNVRMVILTNSLAATDEPLAHTGYARYRRQLLEAGVDLYEISPEKTRRNKRLGVFGASLGRLHAKTSVVDGERVFIGSMNLDPRSETQNTELGIFVESPQLAKELLRIVTISKLQSAYRVRLGPSGDLEWLTMDDEKERVLTSEPETNLWLRVHNMLISPFVPEQLL